MSDEMTAQDVRRIADNADWMPADNVGILLGKVAQWALEQNRERDKARSDADVQRTKVERLSIRIIGLDEEAKLISANMHDQHRQKRIAERERDEARAEVARLTEEVRIVRQSDRAMAMRAKRLAARVAELEAAATPVDSDTDTEPAAVDEAITLDIDLDRAFDGGDGGDCEGVGDA